MDPKHRDRVALCASFPASTKGHENAPFVLVKTWLFRCADHTAGDRSHVEEAYPGDVLGLHNHGTIQIGDTFTQGELMKFTGIPNFAPNCSVVSA